LGEEKWRTRERRGAVKDGGVKDKVIIRKPGEE